MDIILGVGYEFVDVESNSAGLKLAIMAAGFKYDNLNVTCMKRKKDRGEVLWHVSCPKKRKAGCTFLIKISHQAHQQYPTIIACEAQHNHTIQTPESVQAVSESEGRLIFIGDLIEHEKDIKKRLEININHNLEMGPLYEILRCELFGSNVSFDEQCKNKLRVWKDQVKKLLINNVEVTKHCHEDNFSPYLHEHYDYVKHENLPSGETNMIYWSSRQQQEQYRRFNDVIIIDGTAGKNNMNWTTIIACCVDSEFRTQIVGQALARSECKEVYSYVLHHR